MLNLDEEIERAAVLHGKLCPGTVIGVRMAMLGLSKINITDAKGKERKDFLVFVENDRCPVDALQSVTGARLSSRSLKFFDYGKMAASFLNLKTSKAVRLICPDYVRDKVDLYIRDKGLGKREKEIEAYKVMPEAELFVVMDIEISIPPEDMPGKHVPNILCESCRESISDKKEIVVKGKVVCKPCAGLGYYRVL